MIRWALHGDFGPLATPLRSAIANYAGQSNAHGRVDLFGTFAAPGVVTGSPAAAGDDAPAATRWAVLVSPYLQRTPLPTAVAPTDCSALPPATAEGFDAAVAALTAERAWLTGGDRRHVVRIFDAIGRDDSGAPHPAWLRTTGAAAAPTAAGAPTGFVSPIAADDAVAALLALVESLVATEANLPAIWHLCGATRIAADAMVQWAGSAGDGDQAVVAVEARRHRVGDASATRDLVERALGRPLDFVCESDLIAAAVAHAFGRSPPKKRALSYVAPRVAPSPRLLARMANAVATGALTNGGPLAAALERGLAAHLSTPDADVAAGHIVAVSSGSSALDAILSLVDRAGAVVMPAFTFVATLNAARCAGRDVLLCDVDAATWTLDPSALRDILADQAGDGAGPNGVAAVVAVCAYGIAPDLDALAAICDAYDVLLLYDNAHGVGVTVTATDRSPMGDQTSVERVALHPGVRAAAHSLHATKILPAAEGGYVLLSRDDDAGRLRKWRNHGVAMVDGTAMAQSFIAGRNAKLSELHAAVALETLDQLDAVVDRRATVAAQVYRCVDSLVAAPLRRQQPPPGRGNNGQNIAVAVVSDDGVTTMAWQQALARHGIASRRYFAPSLSELAAPMLGVLPQRPTPVSDALARTTLALPIYNAMTDYEVQRLVDALIAVADELR